jgi:hypothetical protein
MIVGLLGMPEQLRNFNIHYDYNAIGVARKLRLEARKEMASVVCAFYNQNESSKKST